MNKLNVVKVLSMVLLVSSNVFGTCFKVINLDEDKGHKLVLDYIASDDVEFNLAAFDLKAKYGLYRDSGDKSKNPKARLEYSFAGNSCWIDEKPFALLRGIHFDGIKINLQDVGKEQKGVVSGGALKGDGTILIWRATQNIYNIVFVPEEDNSFWKKPFAITIDTNNKKRFDFIIEDTNAPQPAQANNQFHKRLEAYLTKYTKDRIAYIQEQEQILLQAFDDAIRGIKRIQQRYQDQKAY